MAARIVVVGAGIIGVMIARELSLRGYRVILVEQASPGGAVTGASLACLGTHMNSRSEIEILKWSASAWAELDELLGNRMEYQRSGQLRFVEREEDLAVAEDWIAFERKAGLAPELLQPDEVRKLEPLIEAPIIAATWAPNAATVTPFLAVRAVLGDAIRLGTEIVSHGPVCGILCESGRAVGVRMADTLVEADAVVLATGPWTPDLVKELGVAVPILPRKAQCLATIAQPPTIRTVIAACESAGGVAPGYTQIQQAPSGQILFNTVLGGGVAPQGAQNVVTEVDRSFVCNSIRTLLWLFPSLANTELLRSWVRYEAVTPDDRFLVGPSVVSGLFLAAGDGGSGFGRSPAVARVIADMLDRKPPPFDASLWAPERFSQARAA